MLTSDRALVDDPDRTTVSDPKHAPRPKDRSRSPFHIFSFRALDEVQMQLIDFCISVIMETDALLKIVRLS